MCTAYCIRILPSGEPSGAVRYLSCGCQMEMRTAHCTSWSVRQPDRRTQQPMQEASLTPMHHAKRLHSLCTL